MMGRRYITPKGQHIPGGYDHEPRGIVGTPAHTDDLSRAYPGEEARISIRRDSNPDNAVQIYDPIIGCLRMITPDELAQLTRKAAQYDEMCDVAVDVQGRGYVRLELAGGGAITWDVVESDGE